MALQLVHFNKWTSANTFLASQVSGRSSIVFYSSCYLNNLEEEGGCHGTKSWLVNTAVVRWTH